MRNTFVCILLIFIFYTMGNGESPRNTKGSFDSYPLYLETSNSDLDQAFRIALGDLYTNIRDFKSGLLDDTAPVILAGLNYARPWTRDASINSWNAGSFVVPQVAKNTLLSVLTEDEFGLRVGGQYWDAVVWITAAWYHYLWTGDREFLQLARDAAKNTLTYFEQNEFNAQYNLFRGLGWSDGVAAYEGRYSRTGSSAAWKWPLANPDEVSKPGYGIPMMAISTNCLYYNAYRKLNDMEIELGSEENHWVEKADRLKKAVNKYLWNSESGVYRFYIDEQETCNLQEALGSAFAVLFGIADTTQIKSIFANQFVAPAGIPCGWPPIARYHTPGSENYARHNGTVWPQIQGFWAQAAAHNGRCDLFAHELFNLAKHAVRDKQFVEIYHPFSGEPYGGLQESGDTIKLWNATNRQTWAATAYIRMIIYGLIGLELDSENIYFSPCVPTAVDKVNLANLKVRDMLLEIKINGSGANLTKILVDGQPVLNGALDIDTTGSHLVELFVGD